MSYSKKQKASLLKKLLPPYSMSISVLSKESGTPESTLYAWRKASQKAGNFVGGGKSKAAKWVSAAKFAAVLETASKNQAELSAWCRERGIYPEQLEAWRIACEQANGLDAKRDKKSEQQHKVDKQKISALERELIRKEKALAETAALLVLTKKAEAIWGEPKDE